MKTTRLEQEGFGPMSPTMWGDLIAERDWLRLALQKSQQRVKELEYENNEAATAIEGFGERLAVSLTNTNLLTRQVETQQTIIQELAEALDKIQRWQFPTVTSREGKPSNYGEEYGSSGERDYMRQIARAAIASAAPWLKEGK